MYQPNIVTVSLEPKFAITTKLKSIHNKPGEIANIFSK
jgi:hypothetical protein